MSANAHAGGDSCVVEHRGLQRNARVDEVAVDQPVTDLVRAGLGLAGKQG